MRVLDCRQSSREATAAAREIVQGGGLIVVPTDTVYGVGADPRSSGAVDRLLTAKGRGREKPSPVLVSSIADVELLTSHIPELAYTLMQNFWPGALTLILPASDSLGWDLGETGGTVAVRMPDDAFTVELLAQVGPLAVSSANITAQNPALTVEEACAQLGDRVDLYLDGGSCPGGVPSTILLVAEDRVKVVRAGALDPQAFVAYTRVEV